MRSSRSTPSRPGRLPIRRWILVIGNDHPRACTGRRLLRLGLAQEVDSTSGTSAAPIVLDPYAGEPLSTADLPAASRGGLLVVDCSWNRLAERGRLPRTGTSSNPGLRRRLPFLIATNPQHYGRMGELNTVEAFAAALWVLGHREESTELLRGFAGGAAFLAVNRDRLDAFARAKTSEAARRLERTIYGAGQGPTRSSAPGAR